MGRMDESERAGGIAASEDRGVDAPLTIAMVVDTIGNRGNGTSNSALQYARELIRRGHRVRMVGIGAPEFPAEVHGLPVVSSIASWHQVQFARPDAALFRRAFEGVDVVHVYLPFSFGRCARRVARGMGIPVTAGFHLQPENVTYSAGPLRWMPGASDMLYRLFRRWLYGGVLHVHAPSGMIAQQLRGHGYTNRIHVISNGYSPRFTAQGPSEPPDDARSPLRIVASGRLSHEKDHITLIRAVAICRHRRDVGLTICGTGPLLGRLRAEAARLLPRGSWSIGFHDNDDMPRLLRGCDLLVHPSIVDIESLSVLEGMASGLVPVIARSDLSAAGQFALTDRSLFPVRDARALAERIDWWYEHPGRRRAWGARYAEHTTRMYAVSSCVDRFLDMESQAIADFRAGIGPEFG
ncbi:glycosyltransferase [uncultured Bifidobacterium sp.]|uniref:glycosyltransferase n=1 Tax=uncultured Bifidobacterium sp. TaxID=165187 RepID=UPI0037DC9CA3